MQNFYATLCIGDGAGYVRIEADDYWQARDKMFASKYGERWAFMYTEAEKPEAIDKFNEQEKDFLC